jgi:HSP20 family protein
MAKDFIRVMQALFLPASETLRETAWSPRVDVYRTPAGWLLKFELAGVRPEDIRLSVCGRRVIVHGCRRDWFVEEGHHHYLMEIAYSHFERSVELPGNLEPAHMATEYRDGMLVVRIETESQS